MPDIFHIPYDKIQEPQKLGNFLNIPDYTLSCYKYFYVILN
jgi:hypothetical protein